MIRRDQAKNPARVGCTMTRPFRFAAQFLTASSADEFLAWARRVESQGYSTLNICDHFDFALSPIPASMAAALVTTKLRVGSLCIDNDFRNPLLLAKEVANVDMLSGGRFELGLGAGWFGGDYDAFGIPFDPPGTRVDRLAEAITVMKQAWAGRPFSHEGRFYHAKDYTISPPPIQKPHPPLLVGCGKRRMCNLAGREADIISLMVDLSDRSLGADPYAGLATPLDWVREGAGASFARLELSLHLYWGGKADAAPDQQKAGMPAYLLGDTVEAAVATCQKLRDRFGFTAFYLSQAGCDLDRMAPVVERLAGR